MKKQVALLLKNYISLKEKEIEKLIEIPPALEMGDYSFPCFVLSKTLKKNPNKIAKELSSKIKNIPNQFEYIEAVGGYLNFHINKKTFAENIVKQISKQKNNFGRQKTNVKKVMVEFPSPNTNKPLHLGHLRNIAIGESISRIIEFNGKKVIRANLNNDRGIHICKSMVAYQKFGKGKKPDKKPDHFVGEYYVLFNKKENKNLIKEAQKCLINWENKEKQTINLWRKMNNWTLKGFEETYKKFGIKHDVTYNESALYLKGKEIILKGLKSKIFKKNKEGSIVIDLGKKLGEKILLRADGTSIYITQDLYLAIKKFKDYKPELSIYVVGKEQEYHFNILFKILEKLGYKNKYLHLSYGMLNLPEGKMKSREGKVVDADDLIEHVQRLAKDQINKRKKISKKELESKSFKIALAAIKYMLLKVDSRKDTIFNPKESINFEGDTGPYILYSYARANSILKKSKLKTKQFKISNLETKEIELIKKLAGFTEAVDKSYKNLNPSYLANYSYQLSKTFNEFYHECPVVNSKQESFRIALVKSFKQVLKNSLDLLGIEPLDKM